MPGNNRYEAGVADLDDFVARSRGPCGAVNRAALWTVRRCGPCGAVDRGLVWTVGWRDQEDFEPPMNANERKQARLFKGAERRG